MAPLNDDELEQNWAAEAVDVSDDDEVLSAGSEDEFEEEAELELATAKRKRGETQGDEDDAAMDDDDEDDAAAKKQKVAVVSAAKKQSRPSKGLHKMTPAEHFKIVNDVYSKYRGGQMTSLELADGLNGTYARIAAAQVHLLCLCISPLLRPCARARRVALCGAEPREAQARAAAVVHAPLHAALEERVPRSRQALGQESFLPHSLLVRTPRRRSAQVRCCSCSCACGGTRLTPMLRLRLP